MKILELFSGYGTSTFALKNLGIEYQLVGYSDIDEYANKCFQQNHKGKELGDIKDINPNELEDFDLLTGGFPCQAFSIAGKRLGELDPRGTLFYEIIRIAEIKKPRYMLLENVKGLTSKKHKPTFDKILSELNRIGYKVHWKILNSKDYNIPQNRERVWFVCFREQEDYDNFTFPEKEQLKLSVRDLLEDNVDEKYYLKEHQLKKLMIAIEKKKIQGRRLQTKEVVSTLQARDYKDPKIIFELRGQSDELRLYDGVNPTINAAYGMGGGNVPLIMVSSTQQHNSIITDGICGTLPSAMGEGGGHIPMINSIGRFRKLTPKECFRLQGFTKDEIDLSGISDSRAYKLCGNGQSVNVVIRIFKNMFMLAKSEEGKARHSSQA